MFKINAEYIFLKVGENGLNKNTKHTKTAGLYSVLKERQKTMAKWINTKDKLPENGEDVLAFDEEYGHSIAWREDNDTWYCQEIGILRNVTHWQALPKAPKGEG